MANLKKKKKSCVCENTDKARLNTSLSTSKTGS